MSRLKKVANNVSPQVHEIVNEQMTNPNADSSKKMYSNMDFVIAKRLLADLPIVPTNERAYELTQQIEVGLFEDICPIEEVEEHWDEWIARTIDYLKSIGILIGY